MFRFAKLLFKGSKRFTVLKSHHDFLFIVIGQHIAFGLRFPCFDGRAGRVGGRSTPLWGRVVGRDSRADGRVGRVSGRAK